MCGIVDESCLEVAERGEFLQANEKLEYLHFLQYLQILFIIFTLLYWILSGETLLLFELTGRKLRFEFSKAMNFSKIYQS